MTPCNLMARQRNFGRTYCQPWFQASTAILMRSALFWDIARRCVVIAYRRFGTTYRSHLQGSRVREGKNAGTIRRKAQEEGERGEEFGFLDSKSYVVNQSSHDAASYPRRAQIVLPPWRWAGRCVSCELADRSVPQTRGLIKPVVLFHY